ncbi:hypothetical protein SY2F82_08650 [Streptomyces sp. Y2F8-2]|nr:hypothetical protein SY2F82_08650 [Streptomyces sp. Y2F8-2]
MKAAVCRGRFCSAGDNVDGAFTLPVTLITTNAPISVKGSVRALRDFKSESSPIRRPGTRGLGSGRQTSPRAIFLNEQQAAQGRVRGLAARVRIASVQTDQASRHPGHALHPTA